VALETVANPLASLRKNTQDLEGKWRPVADPRSILLNWIFATEKGLAFTEDREQVVTSKKRLWTVWGRSRNAGNGWYSGITRQSIEKCYTFSVTS
jgi:hypothetical protein